LPTVMLALNQPARTHTHTHTHTHSVLAIFLCNSFPFFWSCYQHVLSDSCYRCIVL